jgi:hypothetical protein
MYTLEPLRREGIDSLDVRDVPGIKKVLLREIEAALENGNHEVIIRAAADIFHPTTNNSVHPEPVPERGTLTRAIFEFQFTDSAKPRLVELRPPNILKFGRRCDAQLVQQFLANRAFRIGRK